MTHTPSSDPLKNLVWFMIGLTMLGTIIALVILFTWAVPVGPVAGHPPANPLY